MSSGRSGHGTWFLHLGLRSTLPNKTLDISSSFRRLLAEILRTSTPARSDCKASIVGLQGIYFGNRDQQSCKTSPILIIDRTLTSSCQRSGISQSYFCVVRATHYSNPWASAVVPPFACFSPSGSRAAIFCVTHSGLSASRTTD